MRSVYVFCADGFEEVEGLTAVDLLKRAGIDVKWCLLWADYR